MAGKKAFALRLSPEILKEIETWAAEEFRSTNGQIEYILYEALKARKRNAKKNKAEGDT
ncbi:Arc family DNA binding domain-containing protein [Olivibacter sitiensis]|uniref:Arc family DNA binding domain-containing protein n=1 Tax=Olivibacter sitiensis TaxID=376470 RepID=UPI0004296F9E|nr:Arc family DNA binding domain-containing protein [Olivibacter sitiensis]